MHHLNECFKCIFQSKHTDVFHFLTIFNHECVQTSCMLLLKSPQSTWIPPSFMHTTFASIYSMLQHAHYLLLRPQNTIQFIILISFLGFGSIFCSIGCGSQKAPNRLYFLFWRMLDLRIISKKRYRIDRWLLDLTWAWPALVMTSILNSCPV